MKLKVSLYSIATIALGSTFLFPLFFKYLGIIALIFGLVTAILVDSLIYEHSTDAEKIEDAIRDPDYDVNTILIIISTIIFTAIFYFLFYGFFFLTYKLINVSNEKSMLFISLIFLSVMLIFNPLLSFFGKSNKKSKMKMFIVFSFITILIFVFMLIFKDKIQIDDVLNNPYKIYFGKFR